MADTVKTLEDKIEKMKSSKGAIESKLEKVIPAFSLLQTKVSEATNFVENEFYGDANVIAEKCEKYFGKRVMSLVESRKALQKLQADLKKLSDSRDSMVSEVGGLNTKIETAEKGLEQYKKQKKGLKDALETGTIDKKEYEERKKLIKQVLTDTQVVYEKNRESLKKKLGAKMLELEKSNEKLLDATDTYTSAETFVEKEFMGSATVIAEKCQKFFGKKVMSLKESQKALKKLESDLESMKKANRLLAAETASLSSQVEETEKRFEQYEQDMERTNNSFNSGKIDEKEWRRQSDNFKKSLGIV